MIIIGVRLFFWGSQQLLQAMHCGRCGYQGPFTLKKGMRFITVFFIIPVIPISGVMHAAECRQCKTRYKVDATQAAQAIPNSPLP
ncbi:MAG TPA: hypothetical protein VMT51_07250 [Dongiaceae bacterium]|nr:hypothetical protein [Dongiaceae bacterium]